MNYLKDFYNFCEFYDGHFMERLKVYGQYNSSYTSGRNICYFKWFLEMISDEVFKEAAHGHK